MPQVGLQQELSGTCGCAHLTARRMPRERECYRSRPPQRHVQPFSAPGIDTRLTEHSKGKGGGYQFSCNPRPGHRYVLASPGAPPPPSRRPLQGAGRARGAPGPGRGSRLGLQGDAPNASAADQPSRQREERGAALRNAALPETQPVLLGLQGSLQRKGNFRKRCILRPEETTHII